MSLLLARYKYHNYYNMVIQDIKKMIEEYS
jgi:hypothetical protein